MSKYGVFLSCVNQKCDSDIYLEITETEDLNTAISVAKDLNNCTFKLAWELCKKCDEGMLYKPYDNSKEQEEYN